MSLFFSPVLAVDRAFAVLDKDHSGHIDPRKLRSVMKALGLNPTEAEVQDLIASVDEDGNN